jgi:hypothetical protein
MTSLDVKPFISAGGTSTQIAEFNGWIANHLDPTHNTYVVVAKSTGLLRKLRARLTTKGIPYYDASDAYDALQFVRSADEAQRSTVVSNEHSAAWLTYQMTIPNDTRVILSLDNRIYLRHMVSRGYTLVGFAPSSATFGVKPNATFDNELDIINALSTETESFGKISDHLARPRGSEFKPFGDVARESLMLMPLEGRELVMLGSEIESHQASANTGVHARHVISDDLPTPYMVGTDAFTKIEDPLPHLGDGQRKLLAVNFPIYICPDIEVIISIGGSPGNHLSQVDLGDKLLVIVDPIKPAFTDENIVWEKMTVTTERQFLSIIDKYTKDKKFAVISDIRSDKTGDSVVDDKAVMDDNALQLSWVEICRKMSDCLLMSLKYRPGHSQNFDLIPGDVTHHILQPWVRSTSFETRLVIDWRKTVRTTHMTHLNARTYRDGMHAWNSARWTNPALNLDQSRAIAMMLSDRTSDFLNYPLPKNSFVISLFAPSNVRNSKDKVKTWLRKMDRANIKFVINLPHDGIMHSIVTQPDLAVSLEEDGTMRTVRKLPRGFLLVALPAGSGKTTLSKTADYFIDVDDAFEGHPSSEIMLEIRKSKNPDWNKHNRIYGETVADYLKNFDHEEFHVLLIHGPQVVDHIANAGVPIAGYFGAKVDYDTIQKVASSRNFVDTELGRGTILNWETTPVPIIGTHSQVASYVMTRIERLQTPEEFHDHLYDPNEAGMTGHSYQWSDIMYKCRFDRRVDPEAISLGTNGVGFLTKLWFFQSNAFMETDFADVIGETQGWMTKYLTAKLRDIFGLDNKSLYAFRRNAVANAGGEPTAGPLIHGMIDGKKITIAGHMVNLLTISAIVPVDINRYLEKVRFNVALQRGSRRLKAKLRPFVEDELLTEDESDWGINPKLWHSYYDYVLSIDAFLLFADFYKFRINEHAVTTARQGIESILKDYPWWKRSEGFLTGIVP